MIKIDSKGFDNKIKTLKSFMTSSYGKQLKELLAKDAGTLIYKRVKSGYGVTSDEVDSPQKSRLASLSSGYIKRRKIFGPTGSFAGAGKSNLTYTGKMLEAIASKSTSRGFEIFIKNSSRGDGNTNNEIASYVRDPKHGPSRPFFALTVSEQRVLQRTHLDYIRKLAQKLRGL